MAIKLLTIAIESDETNKYSIIQSNNLTLDDIKEACMLIYNAADKHAKEDTDNA